MNRQSTFRIAIRKFGPFESALQKQWEAFDAAARTGLTLDARALDLDPLQQALFETEGLARGDWDVALVNTDWVALLHDSSCAVDIAPYLRSDPPEDYPGGWTQSLLRLQEINGRIFGLPYHDGPECLIYRRDLFEDPGEQRRYREAFGAPLRVPQTWPEFHRIAKFFHRPQRHLYGSAFAAYPDGHNMVYDFLLQLWTRGGDLFDAAGRPQFNAPPAVEALSFYRSILRDASAVHPACRQMDSVKSGLSFAAGEVAMMVNWFGFAAMSEAVADSRVKGRVGIAEIPHAENVPSASLNVYWILSIGSGSPHRETAYRFLRWCASAEMDKLLTIEGGIGCRKSTWTDAEVNRVIPFYRQLETLHANARELPRLAKWPRIAELVDELMMSAIDTQQPPEGLLREAGRKAGGLALYEP